jgi:nucleoside-diphosphate-sugar epimerase
MILITGATGFLGSVLTARLLDRGVAVRCIRRSGSVIPGLLAGRPVEWVEADMLDYWALERAFAGITGVYHCAALVSFRPSDREKLRRINAEGAANVVNLCIEQNVRLVHVSSVAALGEPKPGELITERDHWQYTRTQSGYAISKYEAEMEVWRGMAEGLNAVIVNPSLIIGRSAGDRGSGQLFRAVRKGLKVYPKGSLGIVDVNDVAEVMIRLMESNLSGERYIVSSESLSYRELFSRIAEAYHLPEPRIRLYRWQVGLAWRLANVATAITGKEYALTSETAKSAFKQHDYDPGKLLAALPGFAFQPVADSIKAICRP